MKKHAVVVALVMGVLLLGSGVAVFADNTMGSSSSDPQVGITKDQLVQQLGQPLSSASDGNGGTILLYQDFVAAGASDIYSGGNLSEDQYYVDASGKVYQHRHSLL